MTREQMRDIRIQLGITRLQELGVPETPLNPLIDWLAKQKVRHDKADELPSGD